MRADHALASTPEATIDFHATVFTNIVFDNIVIDNDVVNSAVGRSLGAAGARDEHGRATPPAPRPVDAAP